MLSGDVLRDYPKQIVSPIKGRNVSTDMSESLSWTQKIYGVDATTPVSQRKTDDACSNGHKLAPGKDQKKKGTSSERSPRFGARLENSVVHRDWTQIPVSHDIRKRHTAPIVETTLLLFLTKATSPTAQHFRHQQDTKITERQLDPAKEKMLEQVLLLLGGYYKRSTMCQFSLHCVDGATEKCRVCKMLT